MTMEVFHRLDIVINNAGVMNDRFWELEVDVNLVSYLRFIDCFIVSERTYSQIGARKSVVCSIFYVFVKCKRE